ncbi:hypothetical protein LOD99_4962 [Oopsacas minuta]|uniref:3-oxo-5-alpha-steroid 4-dehydrogenase C-terminal domain-containing protein n=1 Tax=Oopsacas minuta TaxID=111878 RepID=A0AAV7JTB9_9METZ|nr:hypothetical protein LOD99_4962 [Oopsacas minuta]
MDVVISMFNFPQVNQEYFKSFITIHFIFILFLIVISFHPLPYGRYSGANLKLNGTITWILMESPSLLIPLYMIWNSNNKSLSFFSSQILYLIPFMVHYFHRCLIYPFHLCNYCIPLYTGLIAVCYTSFNGYLQAAYILNLPDHPMSPLEMLRYLIGIVIFIVGMGINMHADYYLIKLSKNKKYKGQYFIPRGYLFEYISCPNFFAETLEWLGYAISNWTLCSWGFFFQTFFTLIPRGYHHHKYYQDKLKDYPVGRRAVIPFIL